MKIKKCAVDGYTMLDICRCGSKTRTAHPPKFSERYGKYRRIAKEANQGK